MRPPKCNICTGRQLRPKPAVSVYHHHYSSREVRIMQGKEYSKPSTQFMCPTCQNYHPIRPTYGLNICLGTSQLHEFHTPREEGVTCTPDELHVDWVTIPGARISTLETAWQVDYAKYKFPMRVLLVAGLNDLIKGGNKESVTNSILNLKLAIDDQNKYHPDTPNEFVVSTLLNPPKLVWFPDTGKPPHGHINRYDEISSINQWIVEFNDGYGNPTPRFHRFGVKCGRKLVNGVQVPLHTHQMRRWRQSEPVIDRLHLNDEWRIRLGKSVIHHFQSEQARRGILVANAINETSG